MPHQAPPSQMFDPNSLVFNNGGWQHLPSLALIRPDRQDHGPYSHHIHAHAPLETNVSHQVDINHLRNESWHRVALGNQPIVTQPQHHCPSPQSDTMNNGNDNSHRHIMSFDELIDIVNSICPEALEAIHAAHVQSTRPVILALKNEAISLKKELQYCASIVPGLVNPLSLGPLYAEQPEAFPLPYNPRVPLTGIAYAPSSPNSSGTWSPVTPESNQSIPTAVDMSFTSNTSTQSSMQPTASPVLPTFQRLSLQSYPHYPPHSAGNGGRADHYHEGTYTSFISREDIARSGTAVYSHQ